MSYEHEVAFTLQLIEGNSQSHKPLDHCLKHGAGPGIADIIPGW